MPWGRFGFLPSCSFCTLKKGCFFVRVSFCTLRKSWFSLRFSIRAFLLYSEEGVVLCQGFPSVLWEIAGFFQGFTFVLWGRVVFLSVFFYTLMMGFFFLFRFLPSVGRVGFRSGFSFCTLMKSCFSVMFFHSILWGKLSFLCVFSLPSMTMCSHAKEFHLTAIQNSEFLLLLNWFKTKAEESSLSYYLTHS